MGHRMSADETSDVFLNGFCFFLGRAASLSIMCSPKHGRHFRFHVLHTERTSTPAGARAPMMRAAPRVAPAPPCEVHAGLRMASCQSDAEHQKTSPCSTARIARAFKAARAAKERALVLTMSNFIISICRHQTPEAWEGAIWDQPVQHECCVQGPCQDEVHGKQSAGCESQAGRPCKAHQSHPPSA